MRNAKELKRTQKNAKNLKVVSVPRQLEAMGFDSAAAADALHKAGGNVEAAVDFLMNE